ncbi:MAG TPA: dethiobiotin synthase [Herpetosiphonaceae bacterium]
MRKGIFVTGTDTGVGKTVVTAALAAGLRARGLRVGVMKPAETGCAQRDGELVPEDALFLRAAAECQAPLELICPYRLPEPLAPALAAELAGVEIEMERLQSCYAELAASHDVVLVEGAGGLLVPLTATHTMRDLAAALDLPVLVVSRNVLGTINHTLLTLEALRERPVLGVVLNAAQRPDDRAAASNARALRQWAAAPLLATLPHVPAVTADVIRALGAMLPLERFVPKETR